MTDKPFKPMLAKSADLDKITFPLLVQDKLDGIRASVVDGKLVSRALKPIPNLEIAGILSRPEFNGLDGELIVGDPTAEGCMQRTSSFVMAPNKTGEPWAFMVFDKWDEDAGFEDRFRAAEAVVKDTFRYDFDAVMVRYREISNAGELEALEVERLALGHEGVIARVPGSPYKFGRSGKTGPLLKIKRFVDFEAEVVGVYEEMHNANEAVTNALGRTERSTKKAGKIGKGTLGGIVVRALNGPCEGIEFRCGTGFHKDERAALWAEAHPGTPMFPGDGLNGRVAKIKSFPIGVKEKPRHPVFLGWRDLTIDG